MSTSVKRSRDEAVAESARLADLLEGAFELWEVAGSVRRMRREVGDVEHVVIPAFRTEPAIAPETDLLGQVIAGTGRPAKLVNALLERLDQLVLSGQLFKAVYVDRNQKASNRWGDHYRGVTLTDDQAAFHHEFFLADADNFGCHLAIRTGPADFSRQLVSRLRANGYTQKDGYLHVLKASGAWDESKGRYDDELGERVKVPNEQVYFTLAGVPWCAPEKRDDVAAAIARARGSR